MNFSTNQVRHLYVVEHIDSSLDAIGDIFMKKFDYENSEAMILKYFNATEELTHSDIVRKNQIRKITATPYTSLRTILPKYSITNTLTAGTDYDTGDLFYLNFVFPAYISLTPEETMEKTICFKYNYNENGIAYTTETYSIAGTPTTLKDNWAAQMAKTIDFAFNKRNNTDNELINIVSITSTNVVTIRAKAARWKRGLYENRPNDFKLSNFTFEDLNTANLSTLPLENNSRIKTYGYATEIVTPTGSADYIENGQMLADLEYFCMGERGDIYRYKGWPNYIETKYLVDASTSYDVVDIHYYFQGEGTNDDKSEKVLTLLFPTSSGTSAITSLFATDDDSNAIVTNITTENLFTTTDNTTLGGILVGASEPENDTETI